ncbi:Tol biopolymer transporter [Haloferula helveola]|uniref:Tol biopolymer transporter n=1 Tax=Haloferula helveola TaxID=490095 RepID=A0ABN6H0E3_9BACT|nr:Tol biopolymer transporter [Haloferula helveola]
MPGSGLVVVKSVQSGGPGATAGLLAGDFIAGADGIPFGVHSTNSNNGYQGAVQDLGMAIDRAEGGTGIVTLNVIRSGTGGVDIPVTVGTSGELGPAWPAGSSKGDAAYEWCCDEIHAKVNASSNGNFGYNSGWFGIILLSHPDWNSTTGARPFRNSIDKLRTRCEDYLNGRAFEPVEPSIDQALYDSQGPGLENWDVCASTMFLALYRSKTGDTSADTIVQKAAEMVANRVQHWSQYNDAGTVFVAGDGRMGHGGVHGDYSHYNGAGGLNIMNAHAVTALALTKLAGADHTVTPGTTLNDASGDPLPDIEEKFLWCWDRIKVATNVGGGSDDGNVGYVGQQGGGDSSGRTGGAFAGWNLYGLAGTADDNDKAARQEDYLVRRWFRQQHAHAYTLGGVALSQMAMPWVGDRGRRHYQENSRFYTVLSRGPSGSVAYFPGRQNNGGDSYLNKGNVALVNGAIATAIRSGNLPGFPVPDPDQLVFHMKAPVNSWPALEARQARVDSLTKSLEVDITDIDGNVLAPASYTASWTHVSGPGTATFGSPAAATTDVTVPSDGTYRVQLEVTTAGYTLTEPIDLLVDTVAPPAGIAPYVVTEPSSRTASQGESVSFTVDAQGTTPLVYQWRLDGSPIGSASTSPLLSIPNVAAASAGDYDCVISNAYGTTTSDVATLSVDGVGSFGWGGLWRDVYTGISGASVASLTGAASYPNFPDVGEFIAGGEAPQNYADNYGQRIAGWITPPENGDYTFYLATDDASELWLSTDATRANRVLIASEPSYRGYRAWSGAPASAPITLVGGQRYYVEVLHKEGGGGDHCSFTWNWQSPGVWAAPTGGAAPLPGAVLEYQVGGTVSDTAVPPANYVPVADPQSLTIFGGAATPITLTGSDFEPGVLTFTVVDSPSKGVLSGTAPNLTYTPNGGASGTDVLTFEVSDGVNTSTPAEVTITLVPESGSSLKTWEGLTDATWAAGSNWIGGASPGVGDAVLFDTNSVSNLATDTGAGSSVERIVLIDPIGAVSIAGGTLTLADGIEMLAAVEDLTVSAPLTLGGDQAWAVGNGGSLTVSGQLGGSNVLTKSGPGELTLNGTSPFSGSVVVAEGTLRLSGGGWYQGYVGGNTTITVADGATVVNVNSHSFGSSNGAARDFVLDGGSFLLAAETYFRNAELTGGLIDNTVGGGGDIRSRSGGSTVTVRASDESSVIAASFSHVGATTYLVEDGAAFSDLLVTGALTNSGKITKDGDGRMTLSGVNTHTGDIDIMIGRLAVTGSLDAADDVLVEGGATLEGTGSVPGIVTLEGGLEPGVEGTAVFSIGTLNQDPAAVTIVELGGTTAGSGYDQLAVTGTATLAGVLDVLLVDGFVPDVGDSFDVLVAGARVGSFGTIDLPTLPSGRLWQVTEDPVGTPGLQLSVVAGNLPPTFDSDPVVGAGATEDSPYAGTLDGTATDPNPGDVLTYQKLSGPGWLTVDPDGSLSGTPSNADVGLNAFSVEVSDPLGETDTATLEITVANVNDPPAFATDPITGTGGTQNSPYSGTLDGSASDPDAGDVLTYSKVSGPPWLSVAGNGTLTGTPHGGDVGNNVFVVQVEDALGLQDTATLEIFVTNVNDPPVFTADPIVGAAATQDAPYSGTLAGTATDPDAGDTQTFAKTGGPGWLTVAPNGSLSGTPGSGDVGSNAFTVQVTDGGGLTDTATLTIEVSNVNDPPTFTADPINGADATEDSAYSGGLASFADDPDTGDTLTFSKTGGPAWLSVGGDGSLSGTPLNDDVGSNVFTVRVTDLAGEFAEATLAVTVINTNDPPVFSADPILLAGADEDVAFSGETLATYGDDPDVGDTVTFSKVSGPAWLTVAPDGALGGTPPPGSAGTNVFVVRATDGEAAETDASLEIEVTGTSLSLPWESTDIGSPGLAGSASDSGGVFSVSGAGYLDDRQDKFQYVWQTLEDDFTITARVSSLQDTGPDARVGIMVRDTLGGNSRHVFLGVEGSGGFRWVRRTSPGARTATSRSGNSAGGDPWLRLQRVGGMVTAYKSLDGTNWIRLGSLTANLPSTCYLGLVVASGDEAVLNASEFDSVSVTP